MSVTPFVPAGKPFSRRVWEAIRECDDHGLAVTDEVELCERLAKTQGVLPADVWDGYAAAKEERDYLPAGGSDPEPCFSCGGRGRGGTTPLPSGHCSTCGGRGWVKVK